LATSYDFLLDTGLFVELQLIVLLSIYTTVNFFATIVVIYDSEKKGQSPFLSFISYSPLSP